MRSTVFVLDSWPLVAWFKNQEPGASRTDTLLENARAGKSELLINVVNVGEVYYSVAKASGLEMAERALQTIYSLPIKIISTSDEQVMRAARLKGKYPIAYGDAFAALIAMERHAPVVTGDKELRDLGKRGVVSVEWVGEMEPQ